GPNLFFTGLQEAWRHHLAKLWVERKVRLGDGAAPESFIRVPAEALYYACLGCVEVGRQEAPNSGVYVGSERLSWWIEEGQHEQKAKVGARALVAGNGDLEAFLTRYGRGAGDPPAPRS